jgi:hypothetical protein
MLDRTGSACQMVVVRGHNAIFRNVRVEAIANYYPVIGITHQEGGNSLFIDGAIFTDGGPIVGGDAGYPCMTGPEDGSGIFISSKLDGDLTNLPVNTKVLSCFDGGYNAIANR